ncbi:MAG: HNH endonuclease [Bacillota bacterium]
MPNKPARPCRHPYCRALVTDDAYCPAHKKQNTKHYDKQRGTAAQRGYGGRWQRYRLQYLKEHPLCVICFKANKLTPSRHVDHIIAVSGPNDPLFWDGDNHQALCANCHSRKTVKEDGGFGRS